MKLRLIACYSVVIAFLLGSCSTKKVLLDPVTVTGNANSDTYRGSYTKTTDIVHTRLDLNFNWDSAFVIGKAYITAKPYFYALDKVTLNARGFKINSVELIQNEENIPLKYTYDGNLLTIQLNKTYLRNQKFGLFIDYVAMPYKLQVGRDIASEEYRGIYFINRDGKDKDKPRQIWTQGETEYNSSWFPTINGPQEKMTQEISITVPKKLATLSNGALDFSSDNGDGTRTDTWRQELPHSTYLTMIAAGDFVVTKDKWRDKEVNYYMEPAFAKNAKLIFGKTPEMIEFFSKKLGIDFPWDKYSQIVVRDFPGGAMENTSATVFFEGMNMTEGEYLDNNHEDIISHELFHHWFGDMVTCESWANLPLNESFATYGEYLWNEYKYGRDYADYYLMLDKQAYFKNPGKKDENVIRYNYADKEQMFDVVSYQKGGQILHMLRKTVGDDAFFQALKLYLTRNAYKTAEINDLRLAFEEVTGQDLNWFFNEWFLSSGNPVLNIQTSYNANAKEVMVIIQQKQDLSKTPLYRIPLAIDIYRDGKTERKEVVLKQQEQRFTFEAETEPSLINVDAEKYVLAEKNEQKPLKQYIYQYQHAPLFMDRFEAIGKIISDKDQKFTHPVMITALEDKSAAIRQIALSFVSSLNETEKNSIYNTVKNLALKDPDSHVRAKAVEVLKKSFEDQKVKEIFRKTLIDKSPAVKKATEGTAKTD
ncbi:M1 family aminopeptidase [Rubrolithibacter danxiaensis]|uniref:M1 family aminopeptidase n=1 Tax=Rubrolithibacter danxiaensis TaxID=3390805 RepID=UPI003BF8BA6A